MWLETEVGTQRYDIEIKPECYCIILRNEQYSHRLFSHRVFQGFNSKISYVVFELLLIYKSQSIYIKRILALKHIGGIREVEPFSCDFGRCVFNETVEKYKFFFNGTEVNHISPHLRRAISIFPLFTFVNEETAHRSSEHTSNRVVIEDRLNHKERFLVPLLAE